MLSDAALHEFKKIYKREYGTELTDTEALALGINLLTILDQIYKPIRKEWWSE
ncbi:hypothetical protein HY605_06230 [Candidatus Peregrinibacteria bacterium]|nr:hypothetical protein [Candidatus Peregrinibacteria bacterium]